MLPSSRCRFAPLVYLNFTTDLQENCAAANMPIAIKTESNVLAQAVIGFVPIAAFLLILYFLFRQQIRMAGKGALNFGKVEGADARSGQEQDHLQRCRRR